ncbi:hypothetical protein [Halorarum halobium]|uniref:hypothetical protein n=1 Tax=Halorarum halobium TaxID=3075121 RepID=UPI0028AD99E0|nr:hypothetical protein [Halobaculum sp. XH14]
MDFPEFVKEHPAISVTLFLALILVLGFAAVIYSQGTVIGGSSSPCSWQEAVYPGNDTPIETKEDFRDYVEDKGATVPDGLQLEYRDGGNLYYKAPCGSVGGGGTSQ